MRSIPSAGTSKRGRGATGPMRAVGQAAASCRDQVYIQDDVRLCARGSNLFFRPGFEPFSKFPRDEAHLSIRCFLVVPDRVRLSQLCREWPCPCSSRGPAGLAVFAFLPRTCRSLIPPPRWYRLTDTALFVSRGQSAVYYIFFAVPRRRGNATHPTSTCLRILLWPLRWNPEYGGESRAGAGCLGGSCRRQVIQFYFCTTK